MAHLGVKAELAAEAPGLVGAITRWMTLTAIKPQPALSLSAALSIVAALKGHRVRTETNLRTNLLLANVAPSGTGKNHPIECAKALLSAAGLTRSILLAEPASNAGLMNDLQQKSGRGLLLWDEFGLALKQMTFPGAGSHQKEILTLMTKLFSCAGTNYVGLSYSEASRRDVQPIEQPNLVVLGASTPKALYGALNSNLVENGFVARYLFVEPAEEEPGHQDAKHIDPPQGCVDALKGIDSWLTFDPDKRDGENVGIFLKPEPAVVPLALDTKEVVFAARFYFEANLRACKDDDLRAIWARGEEHMLKVALTVCDGLEITAYELQWSFQFVRSCLDTITYHLQRTMADSPFEQKLKKVESVIESAGVEGIDRNSLTRRTQFLPGREREDIIRQLLESGNVIAERIRTGKRPVTLYRIAQ